VKKVLVIGAGPIGLTAAKILNAKTQVIVIYPKDPITFNSSSTALKLNQDSSSGTLWGNSEIWGNQHDICLDYLGKNLEISDLTLPAITAQSLEHEVQILKKLWRLTGDRHTSKIPHLSENIESVPILKKEAMRHPRMNIRSIKKIQTPFKQIDLSLVCQNQITIDDNTYEYDYLVIAAGGLSNVFLLTLVDKANPKIFPGLAEMLGAGYSNHIRIKAFNAEFSKFIKLRPVLWRFKGRFLLPAFNFLTGQAAFSEPKITFRYWPSRKPGFVSQVLQEIGYFKSAELILYLELPQIRKNRVKFVDIGSTGLSFQFDYEFSEEVIQAIHLKLQKLEDVLKAENMFANFEKKFSFSPELFKMDSHHHFGGTRMGGNDFDSVVDNFGKLHNSSNIYVVGTSVLSRSFSDHPTWLASLFAIRTAEHIMSLGD
jgi:hypothetical protein